MHTQNKTLLQGKDILQQLLGLPSILATASLLTASISMPAMAAQWPINDEVLSSDLSRGAALTPIKVATDKIDTSKLGALIEPLVQTLAILQHSQTAHKQLNIAAVLRQLADRTLYEPWFEAADFHGFAKAVASEFINKPRFSQNNMGFITEFYGYRGEDIARELEYELVSLARNYLRVDLNGAGEGLRLALMKRLNQSPDGVYGSIDQLRKTYVLQATVEMQRDASDLFNAEPLKNSFAALQAAYEQQGLGVSPLEVTSLMYINLVKGDWAEVEAEYHCKLSALLRSHTESKSLTGRHRYQLVRSIFSGVADLESDRHSDREQLQTIAVQLLMDSNILERSDVDSRADQLTAAAKRLPSVLPVASTDKSDKFSKAYSF